MSFDPRSDLPECWLPLDAEQSRAVNEELRRELPGGHVLNGIGAQAFAERRGRDDVLFRLDDGSIAWVHLTWNVETDPRWPSAEIFADFAACKHAIEQDND